MHEYEPSFLQLFFSHLPAFVWVTDAELRITLLEGSVLPRVGLDEAAVSRMIGTRGESLFGRDTDAIVERLRPLQRGHSVTFEMQFQGRWYSATAEPLRDENGTIIGTIGVGIDATERHQLDEQLTQERDALAETQQLAGLGSWTRLTGDERITLSRQLARILGVAYNGASVPYADVEERIHPDDLNRFLYELSDARARRDGFCIDHRIVRPDGAVRHVRTQGTYEFDRAGNPLRCLGTMIDTTERVEAQLAAERLAYHDALTNLPNRLLLADRIAQNIALAQREHQEFFVLFVDLDRFKDINDTIGHAQGDLLLVEVANRLRRVTRTTDTVARSGGDEFIILLTNLPDQTHLDAAIAKVRSAFVTPFSLSDGDHVVTASIGYAAYPDDGTEAAELLQHADAAMYDAKRAGRNIVRRYAAESAGVKMRRMQLEVDLAPALAERQFMLFYQPIVDARSLALTGVEALLRWRHPTRGLLEPDDFIELAEHSDFIVQLGHWIVHAACAELAHLRSELHLPLRLSINISPRQVITRDHLVGTLESALHESRIEPSTLDLELTETALMREFEAAVGVVARVRELGVGISIDDFGTGYNSFAYLKYFPATTLKIDRSFISSSSNAFNEAISTAIATLGKSIGLRVIAEGVETQTQCMLLQAMGCDALQGFYFAPPLPPEELIARYSRPRANRGVTSSGETVAEEHGRRPIRPN